MTTIRYTSAWVPDDDPERGWDEAADLGVDWLLEEAKRLSLPPLLVTPTQSQWHSGPDIIGWFARTYDATTPRGTRASGGGWAVLAYVPNYDLVHIAANYARDGALAIVETTSYPLAGWAIEAKAFDLISGAVTGDERTANQIKQLDRIHFYGNNGWGDTFGAKQVAHVLRDMSRQGELNRDVILGCMAARGHHGKAVARLSTIIDKLR